MKKRVNKTFYLSALVLILVISSIFLTSVSAVSLDNHAPPPQYSEISVLVDGIALQTDVPPQIIENVTMVPMRPIFEALDINVQWYESSKQIFAATNTGDTIFITPGSKTNYFNNFPQHFDVPAQVIGGHTFVPLRVVAQAIGADVIWAPAANAVIINTPEYKRNFLSMRTNSSITLPDRKLTPFEMEQWLSELEIIGRFHTQEMEVIALVNQEREAAGLGQLAISPILSKVARFKSQYMSDLNYYSHVGVYGNANELARAFGFDGAVGENLYKGPTSPKWAFLGWMLSQGHRDLMLMPNFDTIGVGLYVGEYGQFYWTMLLSGDDYSA